MTTSRFYDNQLNNFNSPIDMPFVINKNAKKISDKNELINQLRILNLHGVNTPLIKNTNQVKKIKFQRIYYLPVFQQRVLGFFKLVSSNKESWTNTTVLRDKNKGYLKEVSHLQSKREERRVKKEAVRATYALNLDYAVVKIGVTIGAKAWVIYVNPYPKHNSKINALLEKAEEDFIAKWDRVSQNFKKNVVLGADPEFVLQDKNGNLILASTYLPKRGMVGCDYIWTNRDRTQLPLAELRPAPANDVRKLVINLYKSMLLGTKKISNRELKWLAGAMPIKGYPLGGHIHFSNLWLNSFLLRALDNYLTLTITLLEDKNGIARRPKYGFLGDYRLKSHNGFEYRTLPSWLVSPTITKGVLALAKLIAENYFYLYQNPLKDVNIQIAYYTGNKEVLRPIVKELWQELKQLKDFSLYEKYLIPLENLIEKGFTWDETKDIRRLWLLPPFGR
ncbi:hypothetical protein BHF71_06135 [Vulcanibacillus modesticaldus]|uniref:PhiEco32-like amidoligase-type 2 protein n=1 Tax=Vulcanibacillus modesticaldus TaxID=337097 RepID=A0A1D2YWT1_9BACI|nr:hypothetical protein [Vulcanibacillus modesticaldus]OEG00179.1 hypothetical protein BHF71_06135 [Vulcanibacillus modesticaldus]